MHPRGLIKSRDKCSRRDKLLETSGDIEERSTRFRERENWPKARHVYFDAVPPYDEASA